MKKILFNDRYDLDRKVERGQKTKTRRNAKWDMLSDKRVDDIDHIALADILNDGRMAYLAWDADDNPIGQAISAYHIGEEVAVAQSYKDVVRIANEDQYVWQFLVEKGLLQRDGAVNTELCTGAGWTNKMFVRADFMPLRIRITGIRMERLQDISNEDCLAEGVEEDLGNGVFLYWWSIDPKLHEDWRKISDELTCHMRNGVPGNYFWDTPQKVFAILIDKVSGTGTWNSNPWVWVYSFELVK